MVLAKYSWFGKSIWKDQATGRVRVVLMNPPAPSFASAPEEGYYDAADLARWRKVDVRTVQRHVAEGKLTPARKVGKENFFTKKEAKRWFREVRVVPGPRRPDEVISRKNEVLAMPTKKELLEENDELLEKLEGIRDQINQVLGDDEDDEDDEEEDDEE